jgi:pyruvate formate lyase activating enzyme
MPDTGETYGKELRVCGFEGVSLVDYPHRVSSVLFLGGCNFRCPFCHNADLVLRPDELPSLSVDDALGRIAERRSLIDGVVITGGEPLLCGDKLLSLLRVLHEADLAVKLDTNGYEIDALREVLDSGLVDYVAMDVKTSPGRYSRAAGRTVDPRRILQAVSAIKASAIAHEFRTTCVPGIVEMDDIVEISRLVGPDGPYVLQQFRASHGTIHPDFASLSSYPPERLREFALRAGTFVSRVTLRGG